MGRRFNTIVTDSTGTVELTGITFGEPVPGTPTNPLRLRILNAELVRGITEARLNVIRADMLIVDPVGEDPYITRRVGSELVAEAWLEARIYGDVAWTPIDEYANYLALGAIPAQNWVDLEIRLNIPVGAATFADTDYNLVVRSR